MAEDFDPRFDPAFQRGYKPAPGERSRTRANTSRPPVASASAPPAPTPIRPLSSPEDEVEWADDESEPELEVAVPVDVLVEPAYVARFDAPSLLAQVETAPRRNPYFLGLWIMGFGFIVLGILLYVMSVATSYTTSNTTGADVVQLIFSQLGWMLAAPLITVGLLTLVVLVLIQGLRARPAREE